MRQYMVSVCVVIVLLFTSCGGTTPPESTPTPTNIPEQTSWLNVVKERGKLICGVNGELPGFSWKVNETYEGFDVDFCRVIATAIFGDRNAVEFVALTAEVRFRAIARREVDILMRNTTWSFTVDTGFDDTEMGNVHLDFGPVLYYDGQRFMVPADLQLQLDGQSSPAAQLAEQGRLSLESLSEESICVLSGTTSVGNLQDEFNARQIKYFSVEKASFEAIREAYTGGECNVVTSDGSQLNILRQQLLESPPESHIIIDEPISREPLSPVYLENDSEWQDVVNWAIFATIRAEELGISSMDDLEVRASTDPSPEVRRLLGGEGLFGVNLGLSHDFALNIIQQVGNYGEIYDRNLGPATPYVLYYDIETGDYRGPNKVGQGGLLITPSFR